LTNYPSFFGGVEASLLFRLSNYMDSIISIFHIDVKLLIAQAVNFGIIFFVLYRFAFKPISKIMQERTKTIEESIENAKRIEEKLSMTEKESTEVLAQAQKEHSDIIVAANKTAEDNRQKSIVKTKEEMAEIIKKGKENIQAEKEAMFKELKKELGDLVILATEKIINEKINSEKDKEIISSIIK
jgi:F-type H+-transporting ATPase subunit b